MRIATFRRLSDSYSICVRNMYDNRFRAKRGQQESRLKADMHDLYAVTGVKTFGSYSQRMLLCFARSGSLHNVLHLH